MSKWFYVAAVAYWGLTKYGAGAIYLLGAVEVCALLARTHLRDYRENLRNELELELRSKFRNEL